MSNKYAQSPQEQVDDHRIGKTSQPVRNRTMAVIFWVLALPATVLTVGAIIFMVAAIYGQYKDIPSNVHLLAFKLVGIYVLLFFGGRGIRLWRTDARLLLVKDPRPPILYLRPFDYDLHNTLDQMRSEERLLTSFFKRLGPVIAIGKPGEQLQPVGAPRIYLGDTWQEVVVNLMNQAKLIIIACPQDVHQGTWWEIEESIKINDPQRLIFYLPFPENPHIYQAFRQRVNVLLSQELPSNIGYTRFINFGPNWEPKILISELDKRDHSLKKNFVGRIYLKWVVRDPSHCHFVFYEYLIPILKRFSKKKYLCWKYSIVMDNFVHYRFIPFLFLSFFLFIAFLICKNITEYLF